MKAQKLSLCGVLMLLASCGGGGNDGSQFTIFEGVLVQGEEATHMEKILPSSLAHGAGEFLENIEICALGECSRTDSSGRWGFSTSSLFSGGEVVFQIEGHGINTTTVVSIPANAREVYMELENHGAEGIHAHDLRIDGVKVD